VIKRYRKLPVEIEAVEWTGSNEKEIETFSSGKVNRYTAYEGNTPIETDYLKINTLEGVMTASKGDYIIKGVQNEYYPCKPDIFNKTYELID